MFPQKLQHIRYLFGRAQARLEEHLESFLRIQLFTRSLYTFRDDFVRDAYEDGIESFYRLMYPLGPFEGYYEAGRSFHHSGFFDKARVAFGQAEEAYRRQIVLFKEDLNGNGASTVRLHEILRSMRAKQRHLERLSSTTVEASSKKPNAAPTP